MEVVKVHTSRSARSRTRGGATPPSTRQANPNPKPGTRQAQDTKTHTRPGTRHSVFAPSFGQTPHHPPANLTTWRRWQHPVLTGHLRSISRHSIAVPSPNSPSQKSGVAAIQPAMHPCLFAVAVHTTNPKRVGDACLQPADPCSRRTRNALCASATPSSCCSTANPTHTHTPICPQPRIRRHAHPGCCLLMMLIPRTAPPRVNTQDRRPKILQSLAAAVHPSNRRPPPTHPHTHQTGPDKITSKTASAWHRGPASRPGHRQRTSLARLRF